MGNGDAVEMFSAVGHSLELNHARNVMNVGCWCRAWRPYGYSEKIPINHPLYEKQIQPVVEPRKIQQISRYPPSPIQQSLFFVRGNPFLRNTEKFPKNKTRKKQTV